uniref:BRCT domain-containing protein n=1 Tax=Globodera rostochiensis TaxID=31243 RepID=A0A914ICA1_GLORO
MTQFMYTIAFMDREKKKQRRHKPSNIPAHYPRGQRAMMSSYRPRRSAVGLFVSSDNRAATHERNGERVPSVSVASAGDEQLTVPPPEKEAENFGQTRTTSATSFVSVEENIAEVEDDPRKQNEEMPQTEGAVDGVRNQKKGLLDIELARLFRDEDLGAVIRKMGGQVWSAVDQKFTHLIAVKCDPNSDKYKEARRHKLPVVLPSWVYAAAGAKDMETLNSVFSNEFLNVHKTPLFAECEVSVSGFLGAERVEIGRLVASHGGIFNGAMSRSSCTHLISATNYGEKYRRAREWGSVKVVTSRWLHKSIEMFSRLLPQLYTEMPSPPPLPSKGQQQHNTNGVHSPLVTSAMLNSLMRHLQQNKMFCSAPTAMPTFPAVAQYPSMMSCNVHNIGTNVHEALFCNNNNNNVQSNEGTATAAHFAKTVDSLHNFLSPNVVLLPVAFHSLDDEQHIQLIGMPQTVIPIAIHPAMQKQFAVRPLLVDQAMARQQPHDGCSSSCCSSTTTSIATLPQHIGIGRVGDNECVFWQQQQQQHHHQPSEEHFQLPVALRPSLVHYAQNEQKQQQQQDFLPTECNFHPKNGRQRPSSSVDKVVVGDDECKTEPLDLSLTTRTKTNENGVGGIGGVVTEIPLVQRRKRTNKGPTDEMAEKEKKLGKTTPESVLDDERRPSPIGTITSSSVSLCCSSSSAFGPPPPLVVPAFSTTAPSCSSSSAVVFTNGTTTKCSSTAATVSAATASLAAADSSTRKRFLCDLCGDVSFLAQETLIGHQKYYCRNRPRLDDVPEPSCPTNSVKKLVVIVPTNGINSASSTVTAAAHTLSSSAKKAALMNNVQCPFQAVNNESMSAHQKQQQHSALPVICADCGYRAFTVRGLRTHVRLSHGTNSAEQTAAVNNNKRAVTTNGNGAAEAGERMAALNGGTTKYFEGTAAGGGE